jgi:hypothetical protein
MPKTTKIYPCNCEKCCKGQEKLKKCLGERRTMPTRNIVTMILSRNSLTGSNTRTFLPNTL